MVDRTEEKNYFKVKKKKEKKRKEIVSNGTKLRTCWAGMDCIMFMV